MQGEEDDIVGGQHLCLDIASCKGERLRDQGEEGAEGKGSREIKDPPGIGGSGPGEGGKKGLFSGVNVHRSVVKWAKGRLKKPGLTYVNECEVRKRRRSWI